MHVGLLAAIREDRVMNDSVLIDTLVLGPDHNGICMTPEEFDAVTECDELFDYELVHGVLIVNPPPLPEERGPNERLGHLLLTYNDSHPLGACLDDTLSEHRIRTLDSRRRADRVIWAGLGRQPDPDNDVPAIAVEFVSQGRRNWRRDYVEKRDEYLAMGVVEYWVIDRFERTMTVFRKAGDSIIEQVVREHETYISELLPGFDLSLSQLLKVADRWSTTSD
jgi:Uma2 family endonuclease